MVSEETFQKKLLEQTSLLSKFFARIVNTNRFCKQSEGVDVPSKLPFFFESNAEDAHVLQSSNFSIILRSSLAIISAITCMCFSSPEFWILALSNSST